MQEDISFGGWVRQRRHILDLTQQELADLVGCARITLRRIEAGALKPSKDLAQILLEKLGAPQTERETWLQFARGLSGFPERSVDSSSSKPSTNLPAFLTTFIGREKERDEIISLLAKYRLVTLVGVGGIGKTRLSLRVGEKLLNDYPDGVWFVALDSLSDPALVPSTIAAVFDIREGSSDRPLLERLIYSLHKKTTLLILDNCEHLLDACAQLIETLLTNCPNLKILTTSREILNMEGEAVYYLPSLSIPDDKTSLETLTDYESIRLFAERASLALASFRVTKENSQPILDICRRVDGIPLAIEMAAARVDILQVDEILRQLNHCFDLLVGKSHTALLRHHTMRASIDWSWGLLSKMEQKFLQQLSVFAGGWTLESAQAVCEGDTLNLTSALMKKSLIMVDRKEERETRYHFHEIVRQYAREKLVLTGEEEIIHTQHLKYFLQLSEQALHALRGSAQAEWMARLSKEHDNIRVALEQAIQTNSVEAGLYLSSRLRRFWENFDLKEGIYYLSMFLQKPESYAYVRARADALYVYGLLQVNLQQFHEARLITGECLELYRALGDQQGEIDALLSLAYILFDPAKTEELNQQAFALAQALGDTWRQANALSNLGWSHSGNKQFVYWEQAIMLFRQSGDWRSLADLLSILGNFVMLEGNLELAEKRLEEATLLSYQLNDKLVKTDLLYAYGRMAMIRGEYSQARVYYQEALEITQELGDDIVSLWCQTHLGYLALFEGKITESYDTFAETAQSFHKDQIIIGVIFSLEGMAGLFITLDTPYIAARLIGWADAARKEINDTRPPIEQADADKVIAACIAKMGEAAFSDAYDEGQKMTIDEAVAFALKES